MTVNEAILEMRYGGIPEEDIEDIMELCTKKGLSPQLIDKELDARGLEKVFEFEYDASGNWYEGKSITPASKPANKEGAEKVKK